MSRGIALVTGGGSGIGRELCVQLHARGYELLAVSLAEPELDALVADLRDGPAVHTLATDLGVLWRTARTLWT